VPGVGDGPKGDDRWCIADVGSKLAMAAERHTWIEAPFNEPGGRGTDGRWRVAHRLPDADANESVSRRRARLNAQFGRTLGADDYEIIWVGFAYRCLDEMRRPGVLSVTLHG
jgi:3-(3-hydroxy-phenyl)propionate hydroxylase